MNEKFYILINISLKLLGSLGSYWQYPSIGLDNSLALTRPQAIIWTKADPIHWRIYAALGEDELMETVFTKGEYVL